MIINGFLRNITKYIRFVNKVEDITKKKDLIKIEEGIFEIDVETYQYKGIMQKFANLDLL